MVRLQQEARRRSKKKRRTGPGEEGTRTSEQQHNQHPLTPLKGVCIVVKLVTMKRWMSVCFDCLCKRGVQRAEERAEERQGEISSLTKSGAPLIS
jgi:hypothetical protein